MRNLIRALAFAAAMTPLAALGQSAPATMGYHTVYGRLGATPGDTGPGQQIPFATLQAQISSTQSANTVYAGPGSGAVALPTFRALVGADLPVPGASSLGGVQSKTCSTSNWFSSLSTSGVFGCSQPAFSDLTGSIAAAQIPNPSASTLGGVQSKAVVSHQFLNTISTSGVPGSAQPACADVSDATVYCNAARGQLPGETSTGSASAGNVGEVISASVASGSAIVLSNATPINITSISLTAGDWDVAGNIYYSTTTTTNITVQIASISQSTGALDTTTLGAINNQRNGGYVPGAGGTTNVLVGPLRISLSGTTTIFLVTQANFTVAGLSGYGILRARRAR